MLRRTLAIGATAAVLVLLVSPPATAEAPTAFESYGAGASSTALVLTLLGQELGVSATGAGVTSKPDAAANGAALLIAGEPAPGDAPSQAPEGPESNEACPVDEDLDEATQGALSGLQLQIACVTTEATIAGGPAAQSEAGEVVIRVLGPGGDVLEPILTPVLEGITQVTDPLIDALEPIIGPINDVTEIDVGDIIDDLITAVGDDLFVLAEIVVAPTVSQAGANTTDGVFGRAGSAGVVINLFPGIASTLAELGFDIEPLQAPLLSVRLGQALAEVVRHPVTGAAAPDASAAQLLSIEASDELGILQGITGQLTEAINGLGADQLGCGPDNPLVDVVCIDLGAVSELSDEELVARGYDFGPGTVGREASAANIEILGIAAEALGGPAVGLTLATADAAANAILATPATPPTPLTPADVPLPRTGGDATMPLALALFAAAAGGVALVRRSRSI